MAESDRRTLVVGDMHLKEELVLGRIDAAIRQTGVERVVFCGDYVDEWRSSRLTMLDALDALVAWVRRMRKRGTAVDLVLGNHDMQYLLRAPGPGTHIDLYDEVTMPPELRRAHQANDKAVMQAYGFDIKTTTETTCVAELMKMYQGLVEKQKGKE